MDGVSPEQLSWPTLRTEWSVRDILNHITGGGLMFATCVEQGSISDEAVARLVTGANLGRDYRGAFRTAGTKPLTAFEAPGAAEKDGRKLEWARGFGATHTVNPRDGDPWSASAS